MPVCLECGKTFKLLNSHIERTHKMKTTEYRSKHGDSVQFSDDSVRQKQKENGFSPWSVSSLMKRGMSEEESLSHLSEKRKNTFSSKTSVRSIEYWMHNGFTKEDALKIVCSVQSRGVEFYTNRDGNNEQYLKHREQIRFSNTRQSMNERGMSDDDIRLMRDNFSISSIMKKYGVSEEVAKIIRTQRISSKNEKSPSYFSVDYFIKRGFSKEDSIKMNSNLQRRNIDFFTKKYGDIIGGEKYSEFIYKTTKHSIGKFSSKESIDYFSMLFKFCDSHNISYEIEKYVCICGKAYYIDVVIPDYMLAFEYDGEAFHADPLVENQKWKTAKGGVSYKDSLLYDSLKQSSIRSIGYSLTVIHSKYKENFCPVSILESKINEKFRIS